MWQPTHQPRHVMLERTSKPGVLRLHCRQCDLGLDLRLSDTTLTGYEEHADRFTFEHWHDGGQRPKRTISLD